MPIAIEMPILMLGLTPEMCQGQFLHDSGLDRLTQESAVGPRAKHKVGWEGGPDCDARWCFMAKLSWSTRSTR